VTVQYRIPSGVRSGLTIIDPSGRTCAHLPIEGGSEGVRHVVWEGMDRNHRPLPSGRYHVVLDARGTRESVGLVLLR
jgi:hypothetical protein